ncbi:hypothetical protein AHAS_Ahas03G0213300 [Arachis hypogaea]
MVTTRATSANAVIVEIPIPQSGKKRKRLVDGSSGENFEEEVGVTSMMDKGFHAPTFIDQHLLLGNEKFVRDCDLAGQANFVYRALLCFATIKQLEEAETTQKKAVNDAKEYDLEILRLSKWETELVSQLARARKQTIDTELMASFACSAVVSLKTEIVQLKKDKEGLLTDAKEIISAIEEALKAQVQVLALDIDGSVMEAFQTMKDGQFVGLE